jgi:hypothetical protein
VKVYAIIARGNTILADMTLGKKDVAAIISGNPQSFFQKL